MQLLYLYVLYTALCKLQPSSLHFGLVSSPPPPVFVHMLVCCGLGVSYERLPHSKYRIDIGAVTAQTILCCYRKTKYNDV